MLGVTIDDEVFSMYEGMKQRKIKCINFKLSPDNTKIIVDQNSLKYSYMKGAKNVFETWASELPDDACLYALYDFDVMVSMAGLNSAKRNKVGFIVWAPSNSKIKDRMILASAKENLRRAIQGIQVEWQLNGREDIDVPDFINTLDQQPGIRHAGHIIGFEGQHKDYWADWKSEARDVLELHGVDQSRMDHHDKMRAQLQISDTDAYNNNKNSNTKNYNNSKSSKYSRPNIPGVRKLEQRGGNNYEEDETPPNLPARKYSGNSYSNNRHENSIADNDSRYRSNNNRYSNGSKYESSVSQISPRGGSGSFKNNQTTNNNIGMARYGNHMEKPTTSSTTSSTSHPNGGIVNTTVEYRNGVKVITEEIIVQEDDDLDNAGGSSSPKKKKKKKSVKENRTPEEEARRKAKKDKKKAKKLREGSDTYHEDSGKKTKSVLDRIQRMNLG